MRSYYELGQFSKFIQRGAVRIETPRWVQDVTSANPPPAQVGIRVTAGTDNVAFRNPNGTRVLVVYDHSKHSRRFGVEWHRLRFDYTLRAGATVTFIWQGAVPERSPCVNAGVDYESIANPETGAHSLRAEPDCRRS
jgi:glucosylceramidase